MKLNYSLVEYSSLIQNHYLDKVLDKHNKIRSIRKFS